MAYRPIVPQNMMVGGGLNAPSRRQMRRPQHRFQVRTTPWAIQPIAIAPVLPGDTLEGARLQARAVTDPLDNKLLGWWQEFHVFYVPHRATSASEQLQAMVLSPEGASGLTTVTGGATATYRLHGRPDFVSLCLEAVVNEFFRDEGDTWTDFVDTRNGLPLAKLGVSDWMNSLVETTQITDVDLAVDLDANATIMASEVEAAMIQWQFLRQNQLTEMSYEDFLGTYGVRTQRTKVSRPELLRSIREWSFPTNTVTQGTGAVSSAAVWSIAETLNKKRFFAEPGWLFAVSVTKPKVYRRGQPGAAANLMTDAYTWLPAVLRDDPYTSLVSMDTVSGALPAVTVAGGVTADMRDLFLFGDQFLASSPSVSGADSVAAGSAWSSYTTSELTKFATIVDPNANDARQDYPNSAGDPGAYLFSGAAFEARMIHVEGIITFDVASAVVDVTPGVPNRA